VRSFLTYLFGLDPALRPTLAGQGENEGQQKKYDYDSYDYPNGGIHDQLQTCWC
jgi:hypothetical protein